MVLTHCHIEIHFENFFDGDFTIISPSFMGYPVVNERSGSELCLCPYSQSKDLPEPHDSSELNPAMSRLQWGLSQSMS